MSIVGQTTKISMKEKIRIYLNEIL